MATLNNNQVYSVVNDAIKMATGATEITAQNLQDIIDIGNDSSVIGSQEQFTKSLINVLIRNWFTDSSYRSSYNDPFFEDSKEFGAITQTISIEIPEVKESSAWQNFTNNSTIGTYSVYLPIVHTQYYGKSVSWELPITITGEQWDTAFKSAEELEQFVAFIFLCIDNAIVQHLEDMNMANRNNFIAEKIAYSQSTGATGVHVVNLVELYQSEQATPSAMTAEEFLNNQDALRDASKTLALFKDYMERMSVNFNTAGRKRFTPEDRLVLQVLSFFDKKMRAVALSNTYHEELVNLPKFESIPYWQGTGKANAYSFDEVSKINVEIASDGTAVNQSGIVAFMCDKWAILHTIVKKRIASKVFEPEDLTNYYYQFVDRYANNLTMNAIVFVVADYTP